MAGVRDEYTRGVKRINSCCCVETKASPPASRYNRRVEYTLKRSARARALRLTVHHDGAVVVTAPYLFGLQAIEKFLTKHSDWVRHKVEETKEKTVIRVARGDIPLLKRRALAFVRERCAHYAKVYGVSFRTVSIRAQKSRWGSCSHKSNLSFNYRIAALPAHIADYIVAHEICHLLELNHSERFWSHVARAIPEYKAVRREMRDIVMTFR